MRYLYPDGKEKALTFSYDDGQEYDRKLVGILNKYGLKGTFHLNSGTLGGTTGEEDYVAKAEVATLYAGHEVDCHGVEHKNLPILTEDMICREIYEDRRALEVLTGKMVRGLSYAFGTYSPEIIRIARAAGIKYSRTVNSTGGFFPPVDFMAWHPTCHHSGALELADQFLNVPDYVELPLMYVWGHSFEFGRSKDWSIIEALGEKLTGKDNIWYATNGEICEYLSAVRSLEYTIDKKTVYNPTAISVWVKAGEDILEIKSGETRKIG